MTVPEAVKKLRTALGLTQQEFSNRLGLAVTSVSRYETGYSAPTLAVLRQLEKMARETGREDLANFFIFGTEEAARLSDTIAREMLVDVDRHYLESAHRYAKELALMSVAFSDPHAAELARKLENLLRDGREFVSGLVAQS